MSTPTGAMGGRLPLAEPSSLSGPQRALFDRLTRSVVPWAERAGFASRFQAAEEENTTLSDRVRQVVILAVGAVWRSAYELYAHSAAARTAGLSREAVDTLAAGGVPDELSDAERCAWRFARQLAADRRIDPPLYDEAREAFGTRGLVDMLLLIGAYQTVCGLLNAFDIPAPESP